MLDLECGRGQPNKEEKAQKLEKKQFDVLEALAMKERKPLQSKFEKLLYSEDVIGSVTEELTGLGLVTKGKITNAGFTALEPYRAKRAVFLAAGFGSRLMPITLNTPKPLVRVHGRRLIDGLIDSCLEAGIREIYIVRGYLSEQFDQLRYKYPMIQFLENPVYDKANNIASAVCARYLLQNAYVLESDLLVQNPAIIKPYHYTSNFLAIRKEETDDWCFDVEDGVIVKEKVGGKDCWQMVGISYWDEADGCRLAEDIPAVYRKDDGGKSYWEQVPLVYCREHYQVAVRECSGTDITEIDTFQELQEMDSAYMAR